MPEKHVLKQFQALPLKAKVLMSQLRIREWYNHFGGDVCVAFSGGKDSTVLAHLVHDLYPDVPLIFANTGLEYPEIQAFARKMGAEFVRPKMQFSEVISKYGYPLISKENAEAIYYARRIRNGEGKEQKRKLSEQKRSEFNGSRILSGGGYKQDQLMPEKPQSKRNKLLGGGTIGAMSVESGNAPQESGPDVDADPVRDVPKKHGRKPIRDDKMWCDWRRQAITGSGAFSEKAKSVYNKSKWLPLCRETQFQISHMCCSVMKKAPMKNYQKKSGLYPFIGTLTEESKLREQAWIKHGCNAFDAKYQTSQPMSFWTEQDVLRYIYDEGLEIASVYGDIVGVDDNGFEYEPFLSCNCTLKCTGCQRTGCVYCAFGAHLEKGETRFQRLAKTHPRQYEYCLGGGQWVDNPKYDPTAPKMDGNWENWNPKKIWVPSKEGLGMRKVFEDCNQIYGKDFIRFE